MESAIRPMKTVLVNVIPGGDNVVVIVRTNRKLSAQLRKSAV